MARSIIYLSTQCHLHSKYETFQCQSKNTNLKIFNQFYNLLLQLDTRNLRNLVWGTCALLEIIVYCPPSGYMTFYASHILPTLKETVSSLPYTSRFFFHNSCLLLYDKINMSHLCIHQDILQSNTVGLIICWLND